MTNHTEPNSNLQGSTTVVEFTLGPVVPDEKRDAKAPSAVGSAVRIPLLLGVFISLLLGAFLGIPTMIYWFEDLTGVEFSSGFVDRAIHGAIFAAFAIGIGYAMGRRRLRNWLCERLIGPITVAVDGIQEAGTELAVTIQSPRLDRLAGRTVEVSREIVEITGLTKEQRDRIVVDDPTVPAKHKIQNERPVMRPKSDGVHHSKTNAIEISPETMTDGNTVSTEFLIDEAFVGDGSLFQRLHIHVDMPWWWFDWYARIMIRESSTDSREQLRAPEATGDAKTREHVW